MSNKPQELQEQLSGSVTNIPLGYVLLFFRVHFNNQFVFGCLFNYLIILLCGFNLSNLCFCVCSYFSYVFRSTGKELISACVCPLYIPSFLKEYQKNGNQALHQLMWF